MTKRKPKEQHEKVGRPSKYDPAYCEQAIKLCRLSATDQEMADFFGVSTATFYLWQKEHPEFSEALKEGKAQSDAAVASRLYDRAMGYSHPAVKIHVTKDGDVIQVPYTEHYPPDTAAAIFWLKNRQRGKWRDKQEVEHSLDESLVSALDAARKRANGA